MAEEFQAENEAFMKAINESAPPSLYKEEDMQFSDIKIGDKITAEAEENIKGKTTFEAVKISVFNPAQ